MPEAMCNLTLTPEAMSNPKDVESLKTRDVYPHCKLETLMPEAMRNLDRVMEFVNDDARLVTIKGKSDGVISGAIDLRMGRRV
jgi:hypothetical protein